MQVLMVFDGVDFDLSVYQCIGLFKIKIELPAMLKIAVIFKRGSLLKKTLLIDIKICPNIDNNLF